MLISIMDVLKTIKLEFATLFEGAVGSKTQLCTDILKYIIERGTEIILFPSPRDSTSK